MTDPEAYREATKRWMDALQVRNTSPSKDEIEQALAQLVQEVHLAKKNLVAQQIGYMPSDEEYEVIKAMREMGE